MATTLTTCASQTLYCQVCGRTTNQTNFCVMPAQAVQQGDAYTVDTRNYNQNNV